MMDNYVLDLMIKAAPSGHGVIVDGIKNAIRDKTLEQLREENIKLKTNNQSKFAKMRPK